MTDVLGCLVPELEEAMADIRLKRVYEAPSAEDGTRVLIDRLWPRGLSKDSAALDDWPKDVAPSNELRRWYGHAPERWPEFRARYTAELEQTGEALERLLKLCRQGRVTLLFAARDAERANAVVLKEVLEARLSDKA